MPGQPSPEPAPAAPPRSGGASPARRRDLRASLLLGFLALLVYNANLRLIAAADTYPARYLPFGIWRHGSVLIDPIHDLTAQGRENPYWIVRGRGGHLLSLYPVVLPLLVSPLYLPAVAYLQARGWDDARLDRVARVMEKLTASLVAVAAVALMHLLLRRRAAPRDALLLTVAFAFGTTTWVIGSQALWQHGLAELLLTGALLLVTGPCTAPRALAVGLLCGLLAANRPPDALLAAAVGLYALRWSAPRDDRGQRGQRAHRGRLLLVAGAALPAGLVLLYNLGIAGNLAGGYGIPRRGEFFAQGLLSGLAGLLVSPARGLLVFSPFLLFLPLGLWLGLRHGAAGRGLTLLLAGAAAVQLLFYAKADWRAGACWGPRWPTDLLPILLWMLAPAAAVLRGAGRALLVLTIGAAVAIEAVGAFWYTGQSDLAILADAGGRGGSGAMAAAWDLRNAPFLAELRHPPAARDLMLDLRGTIDWLRAGGRETGEVAPGIPLTVEGWALVDGRSPAAVVLSVDGRPVTSSAEFRFRPDVAAAVHRAAPSGWSLVLDTSGLAPGTHRLVVGVRSEGSGEIRPLAEVPVVVAVPHTVAAARAMPAAAADGGGSQPSRPSLGRQGSPAGLAGAADLAAALLRGHQQPGGYWLTDYTRTPWFGPGRTEMNVFLTAMLVDLLEPVEGPAGLGEAVQRARRHLAIQIEPDGLVRYHGRPGGPTIPALGCVISPDADDTALVWRLAVAPLPPRTADPVLIARRRLLESALATLREYRNGDGLYRTWLTPRERYQCIDPGQDPDPADGGIQMHVYLFLAQTDPPAARALCGALRRAVTDDRLWVYYQEAPLVPLLRATDLRLGGCTLDLPAARTRTAVPGQEVWLEAAQLLGQWRESAPVPAGGQAAGSGSLAERTAALLRRLAAGSFAAVRAAPPLLYHNDLTARTPRFYWSRDFGYALWLRLYLAALLHQDGPVS